MYGGSTLTAAHANRLIPPRRLVEGAVLCEDRLTHQSARLPDVQLRTHVTRLSKLISAEAPFVGILGAHILRNAGIAAHEPGKQNLISLATIAERNIHGAHQRKPLV